MIHIFEFAAADRALPLASFSNAWIEAHTGLVRAHPEIDRASVVVRESPSEGALYDAVVELWLPSVEAYEALREARRGDPEQRAMREQLAGDPLVLMTTDVPIFHNHSISEEDRLLKLFYVIKRAAGHSLAHFSRYYQHVHTLYSTRPPGQRDYVQSHRIDGADPGYDGVSSIWFDSADDLSLYLGSAELQRGVEDCAQFLDMGSFFDLVGVEHRLRGALAQEGVRS